MPQPFSLLPSRCPVCHRAGPSPCAECRAGFAPARRSVVPAALAYQGTGRSLVTALKYRNGRSAVPWLGEQIARLVVPGSIDVVTWAPTSGARRRHRGFDQAELLARAVAEQLGVPCRRLLVRRRRSGPQTGHSRAARLRGPTFHPLGVIRGRVLLVDDVVTTGATLAAAAEALLRGGAAVVRPVAAAAVPVARPERDILPVTASSGLYVHSLQGSS